MSNVPVVFTSTDTKNNKKVVVLVTDKQKSSESLIKKQQEDIAREKQELQTILTNKEHIKNLIHQALFYFQDLLQILHKACFGQDYQQDPAKSDQHFLNIVACALVAGNKTFGSEQILNMIETDQRIKDDASFVANRMKLYLFSFIACELDLKLRSKFIDNLCVDLQAFLDDNGMTYNDMRTIQLLRKHYTDTECFTCFTEANVQEFATYCATIKAAIEQSMSSADDDVVKSRQLMELVASKSIGRNSHQSFLIPKGDKGAIIENILNFKPQSVYNAVWSNLVSNFNTFTLNHQTESRRALRKERAPETFASKWKEFFEKNQNRLRDGDVSDQAAKIVFDELCSNDKGILDAMAHVNVGQGINFKETTLAMFKALKQRQQGGRNTSAYASSTMPFVFGQNRVSPKGFDKLVTDWYRQETDTMKRPEASTTPNNNYPKVNASPEMLREMMDIIRDTSDFDTAYALMPPNSALSANDQGYVSQFFNEYHQTMYDEAYRYLYENYDKEEMDNLFDYYLTFMNNIDEDGFDAILDDDYPILFEDSSTRLFVSRFNNGIYGNVDYTGKTENDFPSDDDVEANEYNMDKISYDKNENNGNNTDMLQQNSQNSFRQRGGGVLNDTMTLFANENSEMIFQIILITAVFIILNAILVSLNKKPYNTLLGNTLVLAVLCCLDLPKTVLLYTVILYVAVFGGSVVYRSMQPSDDTRRF